VRKRKVWQPWFPAVFHSSRRPWIRVRERKAVPIVRARRKCNHGFRRGGGSEIDECSHGGGGCGMRKEDGAVANSDCCNGDDVFR